jgi:hypothetical protein
MRDLILKLQILCYWLADSFRSWRDQVWARDLDSQYCCDGRECGCYGATVRDVLTPAEGKGESRGG